MAKITTDDSSGVKIATVELETPEGFAQYKRGLEKGQSHWSAHPETNELLKFRSENNQNTRIYVKYGDVSKRVE